MKQIKFFILSLVLILAACSNALGPDQIILKEKLSASSPKIWGLVDFEIEEPENLRNKSNPRIQVRYKAKFKLKEDLYKREKILFGQKSYKIKYGENKGLVIGGQVVLIDRLYEKGYVHVSYGLAVSERNGEGWRTKFKHEKKFPWGETLGNLRKLKINFVLNDKESQEKYIKNFKDEVAKDVARGKEIENKINLATISLIKSSKEYTGSVITKASVYNSEKMNNKVLLKFEDYNKEDNSFAGSIYYPDFDIKMSISGYIKNGYFGFGEIQRTHGNKTLNWQLGHTYDMACDLDKKKCAGVVRHKRSYVTREISFNF